MSPADRQAVPVTRKVLVIGKCDRARSVDADKLRHVKDLHAVVDGLGSDDDVVLVAAELSPDRRLRRRVLGQTAEIDKLAGLGDLGERSAVGLSYGNELATLGAGPAPGGGALAHGRAKIGVALEVIKVNLEGKGESPVSYMFLRDTI